MPVSPKFEAESRRIGFPYLDVVVRFGSSALRLKADGSDTAAPPEARERRLVSIGPIGSELGTLKVLFGSGNPDHPTLVQRGCFSGTLEEFISRVRTQYLGRVNKTPRSKSGYQYANALAALALLDPLNERMEKPVEVLGHGAGQAVFRMTAEEVRHLKNAIETLMEGEATASDADREDLSEAYDAVRRLAEALSSVPHPR